MERPIGIVEGNVVANHLEGRTDRGAIEEATVRPAAPRAQFSVLASVLTAALFVIAGASVAFTAVHARMVLHSADNQAASAALASAPVSPAPDGPLTLSPSVIQAQNAASTTSATSTSVQPIYYVYNYPVIERIKYEAPGISASSTSDYDTKLQGLYNKIEQQILVLSQTSSTQNAQTYQVIAQTNRIDQLSGTRITNAAISGGSISGVTLSTGDLSGTVDIAKGGTGTSSAPSYGQVLLGNAAGGYDLVATSSLGIVGGGGGVSLSAQNTWSALQLFSANASSSQLSVFQKAYFGGTATSSFDSTGFLTLPSGFLSSASSTIGNGAQTGGLTISGGATTTGNQYIAGTLSLGNALSIANGGTGLASIGASSTVFTTNGIAAAWQQLQFGALGGTVSNGQLANSSITVSAGSGLSGGGAISLGGSASLSLNTASANAWTALQTFVNASSSKSSIFQNAYFGGTATSTFDNAGNLALVSNGLTVGTNQLLVSGGNVGIGTTTPGSLLSLNGIANFTTATSTFYASGGINLAGGCFSVNGTCVGGASGSGTVSSGTQGQFAFYNANGTTLTGTSTLFVSQAGNIGIGTTTPFTQFTVAPASTTAQRVGQLTLDSGHAYGLAVQGRYAYVAADAAFDEMAIYDFSNPAAPVLVSTTTLQSFGQSIAVQGQYAYLADNSTTNSFEIWNISNPKVPVRVSASSFLHPGYSIAVSGHYVYVGTSGTTLNLEIWDVANPSAPVRVSSSALNNTNGSPNIFVQGNYAYIAESTPTNGFEIWNISNPAAPYRVSQSTLSSGSSDIYVQGHYAYVADGEIWDVQNPAAPTVVSSTGASGVKISVAGRYAYIVKKLGSGANSFIVEDVSNPAAPAVLTTNSLNQIGYSIAVSGRYAIMADDVATNGFEVWDLGGSYIQNIEGGALEAGTLSLSGNFSGVKGILTGGLTVGQSLNVTGSASFSAATSTFGTTANIFSIATGSSTTPIFSVLGNGNVGIGTTTPGATFTVAGAGCFAKTSAGAGCAGATVAGDIYYNAAHSAGGYDVAENYFTNDGTLGAGELAMLDMNSTTTVARAVPGNAPFGVISSAPGLTLGSELSRVVPLALVGRVPVRVDLEGGPIAVGDRITVSHTPGVGMKATTTSYTIGIALEPFTGASATSTIEVFVQPELYFTGAQQAALAALTDFSATSTATIAPGSFMDTFLFNLFTQVSRWLADAGNGIHDLYASIIHANEVHAKELCAQKNDGTEVCVTGDQLAAALAGERATWTAGTVASSTAIAIPGDTSAPVITLVGAATLTIDKGQTYSDPGASVADAGSPNIGIKASVDGGVETDIGSIVLDTSAAGTHTITFSATDQAGNAGTANRTVHVVDPSASTATDTPSVSAGTSATSTDTTIAPISSSATSTPLLVQDATSTNH